MKNDEQIKDDIYLFIIGSPLAKAISGEIRKTKRPHNSHKEDIVVSILSNSNTQLQVASVNINIYVPALNVKGQWEEDTVRTRELCTLAFNTFDVFHTDDYHCHLLEQRVYEVEGAMEYVINNKIEYKRLKEE